MNSDETNIIKYHNINTCKNRTDSSECSICEKDRNRKLKYDKVEEHTHKKVELVSKYVSLWRNKIRTNSIEELVFIDAMCNASRYQDDINTTAIMVTDLLIDIAKSNSEKTVTIILNDISYNRITDLKECISSRDIPKNLRISFNSMDVNCFITEYLAKISQQDFKRSLTLLYVDPYNLTSIDKKVLLEVLNKTYSELIYNFWTSDFERNHENDKAKSKKDKIKKDIAIMNDTNNGEEIKEIKEFERMLNSYFINTKYRKSIIPFEFRNEKNKTMYKILFCAHKYQGIKLFRDALWQVFQGNDYWRNDKQRVNNVNFLESSSDFVNDLIKSATLRAANKAKEYIMTKYRNTFVYDDNFKMDLLTNVNIQEKDMLKYVIKPLVDEGRIKKVGQNNANKYIDEELRIIHNE